MIEAVRKIPFLLTAVQRKGALALLILMVIGMALETLCTGLVIPAIALLTQDLSSYPSLAPMLDRLGNPSRSELVLYAMLSLVVIYVAKNGFLAFLFWRQTRFAFGVQADLSQRLFTVYLRQPYSFHLQRNSAQLMSNVNGEVSLFTDALLNCLAILTEAMVLLGIGALLFAIEPLGAAIAVLVLGGSAWLFQYFTRRRIASWAATRRQHVVLQQQHLHQGFGGVKDVKILGREQEFIDQYSLHNRLTARANQMHTMLQMFPRLWLEALAVIGLTVLVGVMLAQRRDMASILPVLGLFAAAAFRLMPSVNRSLGAIQALRYCVPAVNALYEEVKLAPPPPQASAPMPALHKELRTVSLRFRYPDAAAPALDSLGISIGKGESVGFVGPSGSGKSTLVDVLLGLLTPEAGRVEVDGRNIQADLRAWQDQVGYVPQSIYLTDDSLRRNIAFGLPNDAIDEAAVRRAIRAAQLEEFVSALPDGLDTIIGERGVRLSGGQRQRIGIARALYHDPSVLVLDEATSALDTATELGVMQAVNALRGEKTLIVVAHRLSTVAGCDRLYRLERGRVADEGAPSRILGAAQTA